MARKNPHTVATVSFTPEDGFVWDLLQRVKPRMMGMFIRHAATVGIHTMTPSELSIFVNGVEPFVPERPSYGSGTAEASRDEAPAPKTGEPGEAFLRHEEGAELPQPLRWPGGKPPQNLEELARYYPPGTPKSLLSIVIKENRPVPMSLESLRKMQRLIEMSQESTTDD
ncbi:MAG: hypothetical protein JJ714_06310 [Acidithiobacillus sp.]|jgi:hypothetical protein|uniref:Uncharacterized protein n=1 Tax=Acidithiobacillus caldus TaxID=33059 RepID=A0A1E7Z517_9PROT|nr:hypothetical protein [Acidithiobacillus sp.]OFC63718.1 hypothetical protein BAE30_00070 [Acidithiobacillus caldus]